MNRTLVLAALLFSLISIPFRVNAQVEVSGHVKDSETRDAIPYTNVSAFNQKDSLVTGGITDGSGMFRFALDPGPYRVLISYVGYETDTLRVTVGAESQYLGVIRLKAGQSELGEVVVKSTTRGYTIDKDVQMVTAKMREGSSNTLDVLERMNGLTYDRYNGAVKVDGDTRVILLVNGLLKDQEYIKNLSPERIREVEVMRNPGGRYALEGYTAVINIILKSDYRGTELMALENSLADLDTKVGRPFPINFAMLNFTYTYDKVNLYAKANNNYNSFRLAGTTDQDYASGYSLKYRPFGDEPNLAVRNMNSSYTGGIDYYLNPRHTISFESTLAAFPATQRMEQKQDVKRYLNDQLIEQYTATGGNTADTRDMTGSLFHIFKVGENTRINSEFTYNRYADTYTNSLFQTNGFERTETGSNLKDNTRFYTELNHTLNDRSTIQVGYGNTWREMQNKFRTGSRLIPSDALASDSTDFRLSEMRHKLYAYYGLTINKKLSFKAGIAGETSRTQTAGLDRTFLIGQPYLDFNYAAHQMVDIKLKYRAETEYPAIRQVTPFTQVLDPYTWEQGNPALSPDLTHTLSVRFRFMQGLFSVEPYVGYSNNRINRVVNPGESGIFIFSYDNVGRFDSRGIKGDFTIPLFKQSLIIKSDFDFYRHSITYQENINTVRDFTLNSQLLYINKKYHTVGGLLYQKGLRKMINAQGYDYGNNDFWMVFVQQPFLKQRLTVMMGYILPLDIAASYTQGNYTDTGLYTTSNQYDISMLKNMLLVNIVYRFNQGKSVRNIEKEVKKDVERESRKIF